MIRFEVSKDTSLCGKKRLVIKSTHQTEGGKLTNMLSRNNAGNPMLDVADAIVLRNLLNDFIGEESGLLLAHH
jgi:hypothetical protein